MSRSPAEFERVALCHSRSLLRVARRLTSNPASAEDLVQDCLFFAWKNFHQVQTGTNAPAWLFRILFNCFFAAGRRLRRDSDVIALSPIKLGYSRDPDEAMNVSQALDTLHPDHRTVPLPGVVEGFTCSGMPEIISVPAGTVMSRLARARDALRRRLIAPCPLVAKES